MCRFLAYLGPDVSLESLLLAPPWSLLRQSYEPRFMKRGRVNADGFGAGWYDFDVRQEPALYRRATPIWSDGTFASIAGLAHSGCHGSVAHRGVQHTSVRIRPLAVRPQR